MIKNIIFDIGNVLVDYNYDAYLKRFGFEPEKEEKIRNAIFESPYWAELDRENMPLPDLLEGFVSYAPEYRDDIMRVFVGVQRTIHRRADAIPWIEALKDRGLRVYYLSNYSSLMLERTGECMDFLPLMDGGVFSYEVKSVKPERGIYQAFLRKYPDVKQGESVLIDDSSANAITAIAMGFRVILYKSRDKAIRELEKLCGFKIFDEQARKFLTKEEEEKAKEDSANELAKCMAGECFDSSNKVFVDYRNTARKLLSDYNSLPFDRILQRMELLNRLLGGSGENVTVDSPFFCEYGRNIFLGDHVSVERNCTFADSNRIEIGDDSLISANVQIYTSAHPMERVERLTSGWAAERGKSFFRTYALPVKIGSACWIGGGAILLPGVTIGNGTVIGAGSVVTEDIPANCFAEGNPCRVIRRINGAE